MFRVRKRAELPAIHKFICPECGAKEMINSMQVSKKKLCIECNEKKIVEYRKSYKLSKPYKKESLQYDRRLFGGFINDGQKRTR